jgi:hypothetical protein
METSGRLLRMVKIRDEIEDMIEDDHDDPAALAAVIVDRAVVPVLDELDALNAAIRQVREIHSPEQYHDELQPWCTYCNRDDNTHDDVVLWPCPTLVALGVTAKDIGR